MHVSLAFGASHLDVELDENALVLEPMPLAAIASPETVLRHALVHPLDGVSLTERARRRLQACIAIPDMTRPAVGPWVLPALCAALRDAGVANIDIVVATGSHRPADAGEMRALAGDAATRTCTVRSHDATANAQRYVGTTPAGSAVWIDSRYMQADFRVVVGVVEPHVMAGFSGGAKAVCPGLARLDTIRAVHRPSQACGLVGPGLVAGNPFRDEIRAAALLAGIDFSVQVCMTRNGAPGQFFAGSLDATVNASIAWLEPRVRVDCSQATDIVLSTAGGAPLDRTLYQAAKGWIAGLAVVRPGGDLVLVAELRDGLGSPEFAQLLRNPGAVLHATRDQWMAQHIQQLRKRAQLHVVSSLPPSQFDGLGIHAYRTVAAALRALQSGNRRLVVLPHGPYCVASLQHQLVTLEGAPAP